MSTLLDYIGSVVIFGMLILMVSRVQTNMSTTNYQGNNDIQTQRYAVAFARLLEFDLAKVGYHVSGQKIFLADSTRLQFKADLYNNGAVELILYKFGLLTECAETINPNDRPFKRTDSNGQILQNIGLTQFKLIFYDSLNQVLAVPMTTVDQLEKIRAIDVSFKLESLNPVKTETDSAHYSEVYWQKLIYPRNLAK